MIYLRFLWSLIRHKTFVFIAGRRLGVGVWQLLIHDLSKLSRAEFGPYARRFGLGRGGALDHSADAQEWRDAWAHHWMNNAHHWEYWRVHLDDDTWEPRPMPEEYIREMVADWCGAGRAYTGRWEVATWYETSRERIQLHPDTRARVEQLIQAWRAPSWC